MTEPTPAPPAPEKRIRLSMWLLSGASLMTLLGLGVTIVHFLKPTPLMFSLFMIVGQGSFGLAMLLYAIVIFKDLRRRRVL